MAKIKLFKHPLELNLVGQVWNFRIGVRQIALWRNYKPIFDLNSY